MSQYRVEILEVGSDFFSNMGAGWFATIFIFPGIWQTYDANLLIKQLFFNTLVGIISLIIAVKLKKEAKHAN